MDITALAPNTLRMLFASCSADPNGPLDVKQKALLWHKLHQHDWAPTPDNTPVPYTTVQGWIDGLQGDAKAFITGMVSHGRDDL